MFVYIVEGGSGTAVFDLNDLMTLRVGVGLGLVWMSEWIRINGPQYHKVNQKWK